MIDNLLFNVDNIINLPLSIIHFTGPWNHVTREEYYLSQIVPIFCVTLIL